MKFHLKHSVERVIRFLYRKSTRQYVLSSFAALAVIGGALLLSDSLTHNKQRAVALAPEHIGLGEGVAACISGAPSITCNPNGSYHLVIDRTASACGSYNDYALNDFVWNKTTNTIISPSSSNGSCGGGTDTFDWFGSPGDEYWYFIEGNNTQRTYDQTTFLGVSCVAQAPQPDLIGGSSYPETLITYSAGTNVVPFHAWAGNAGSDSGPFYSQLYIDGGAVISPGTSWPNTAAGQWDDIYPVYVDLQGLAPGTHTVSVYVDSVNNVAESNEGNNMGPTSSFVVHAGTPPGTPTGLDVSCPAPGNTLYIRYGVPTGTDYGALRIDDSSNTWGPACNPASNSPSDYCGNVPWNWGIPGSGGAAYASIPGHSYDVWVHACNNVNGCGPAAGFQTVTCNATTQLTPWTTYCTGPNNANSANNWTYWQYSDWTDGRHYQFYAPGDVNCQAPAPTGLRAQCNTDGAHANLYWDAVTGATGYNVSIQGITYASCAAASYNWTSNGTCQAFNLPGSGIIQLQTPPGGAVSWWIAATSNGGSTQGAVAGSQFTCNATPTAVPNLTAGKISPLSAIVGTATNFQATITNTGSASTGVGFNNLFQYATGLDSNGNGIGVTDIALASTRALAARNSNTQAASVAMTTLGAGSNGQATDSYTFTSPGTYYMRVCADKSSQSDQYGVVDEGPNHAGENDNCGQWASVRVDCPTGKTQSGNACVPVPNGKPDLTPDSLSPTTFTAGTPATLTVPVRNIGGAPTGNFPDLFEISPNSIPSSFATIPILRTYDSGPIGPGGNNTASIPYTFATPGTWYVQACADLDSSGNGLLGVNVGSVDETPNEGNNCTGWTQVTVNAVPNGGSCTATPNCQSGSTCNGGICTPPTGPTGPTCPATPCSPGFTCIAGSCIATGNPQILAFFASPARVRPDDVAQLMWYATGVDSCTLTGQDLTSLTTTAPASKILGSATSPITAPTKPITSQSKYFLTCVGGGQTVSAQSIVNVLPKGVEH